ncbi:hypothetical protein F2Q68_00045340 [Brassica cretica]|uniref:Uncharacterized protein n=1 Tax=Brassica cretica TaxID=69181 RepID=A0A8S9LJT7_BRACR|nr:hypothetical protein F2Q68_00045340 [Brassica cretica]
MIDGALAGNRLVWLDLWCLGLYGCPILCWPVVIRPKLKDHSKVLSGTDVGEVTGSCKLVLSPVWFLSPTSWVRVACEFSDFCGGKILGQLAVAPNTEKRSPKHGKTKQSRARKQPYNYLQQNIDHSSRQSTSTRTISSEKQTVTNRPRNKLEEEIKPVQYTDDREEGEPASFYIARPLSLVEPQEVNREPNLHEKDQISPSETKQTNLKNSFSLQLERR